MRSAGIGNILGYLAGYINLPDYLPWLGGTQFKVLCAIASFVMILTVGISCSTCSERDPQFDTAPAEQKEGVIAFFKGLARSVKKLPPQIKKVCAVQFFAWIGWFPFLFYITTYVGEIYADPYFEENPHLPDAKIDEILENGTRIGTRALLIFAITTFFASVFLPFVIPPTFQAPEPDRPITPATPMTPTTPHSMGGSGYFALGPAPRGTRTQSWTKYLGQWRCCRLSRLPFVDLGSYRTSSSLYLWPLPSSFVARGERLSLVGAIGIPWCVTNWAPFAIISSEISKRDAIRRGIIKPRDRESQLIAEGEDDGSGADSAGVVLGIHNVAIAAPQVIATLVSAIMFKLLQKPRGTAGDTSVAWVLRFGGVCALVAAWLTLQVNEEKEEEEEEEPFRRRRMS